MTSSSTVRTALVNLLKTIKQGTPSNFNTTVPDKNIKPILDQVFLRSTEDSDYPRLLVTRLGGDMQRMPGLNRSTNQDFVVIAVVKKIKSTDLSPQDQLDLLLDDLTNLFFKNDTLGGTVDSVNITDFILDGGALDPEGSLLLRLKTEGFEYSG